ncbi:MAG: YbaB/EbfC family nucleoid-associated protein [Candidatus Zixiibacteriota bacterium]
MNKGNLGQMLKQVQQMQAKMQEVQTELEKAEVEATSGGGMVKVVVNGKNEIVSIKIDPEVVNKDDIEMLQDLVLAAVNSAREKVQEMQSEKMSALTGGLNIPGMNFPF